MDDKNNADFYYDIITLPYYGSKRKKRMSLYDRAAQFSSFKALSGFEDMVNEEGRITEDKAELSEYQLDILDYNMGRLAQLLMDGYEPTISVTRFCPDILKAGGKYLIETGKLITIDTFERKITLSEYIGIIDINFENIICITGNCLENDSNE